MAAHPGDEQGLIFNQADQTTLLADLEIHFRRVNNNEPSLKDGSFDFRQSTERYIPKMVSRRYSSPMANC
jgi:hypothetical protein